MKKKIVLISIGLLLTGFILGLLVSGIVIHYKLKHLPEKFTQEFIQSKMLQNIDPDDRQLKAVEPITYKYAGKVVSLTKEHFEELYSIVDSFHLELKPILDDEQYEKISDKMKRLKSKTKIP
ncbi:MAG: hypothetical protein H8D45_20520 [Bacteroidetes bacterium]|nr:hypothetical protein [Bacteroidota bacterium]MBL7104750.1 hypothetical protein [Bacteroidales bacterium]